jgi:hypothetical protein
MVAVSMSGKLSLSRRNVQEVKISVEEVYWQGILE